MTNEPIKLDDQYQAALDRRHTLVPALTALAEEMPMGKAKSEIRQLTRSLSEAEFAMDLRHSKVATRWLPLLVTGLSTASSARRLSDLVAHTSQECENRRQRQTLLAYPMLVMALASAVFLMLCALVVPTFSNIFVEFDIETPAATRFVCFISDQLLAHPILLLISISALIAAVYGLFRLWVHFALTTRFFGFATAGNSANVTAMASLTRQLAELLSIDVSLPDALWIAGNQCQQRHFRNAAQHLARDAHRGSLSESIAARNFPGNMILALEAGPSGGPSVAMLRELSDIYADRVAKRVDWSTGAVAQATLVAVGVMIGFFMLALLAPLTSLITSLS